MQLLERETELARFDALLRESTRSGHLIVVSGEAGVGKSALVDEFRLNHAGDVDVLVGTCDQLFAPRPLGAIAHIARDRPGPVADAMASEDQAAVFEAVLGQLAGRGSRPAVLVLDDLQWADEATLDLVRFLGRRLDALRGLVVVTHRSDIGLRHPVRRMLGSLPASGVTRLRVRPLSVDAVRRLASDAGSDVDADEVYDRAGGNPFFTLELLAHDLIGVPETVRDAVLARLSLLGPEAGEVLEAAAVLGREVALPIVETMVGPSSSGIDDCVRAGFLVPSGAHVAFRHDLVRQAVDEGIAPHRRRSLHLAALEAIGPQGDVLHRAHHAIASGEGPLIVELASMAGDHCVALGAHREAAALYRSAVAAVAPGDETGRRALLAAWAHASERIAAFDDAIAAGQELVRLLASQGEARELGVWECWLGGVCRLAGRTDESWATLRRGVDRLEPLGPSVELAQAMATVAQLHMVAREPDLAIEATHRAVDLAEELGAHALVLHALDTRYTAMACRGDRGAEDALEELLRRAQREAVPHEVARIAFNLGEALVLRHRPRDAIRIIDVGLRAALDHELTFLRDGLLAMAAQTRFLLGDWDSAGTDIGTLLRGADDVPAAMRHLALIVLGRIRARRGDPGAFEALDAALEIALSYGETQMLHPVRVARAEAAWLAGDQDRAAVEVVAGIALTATWHEAVPIGELALWAARTDVPFEPPVSVPPPFAALLAGDLQAAACVWEARGSVYEAADALGDSRDEADLREALARLSELGARPRAAMVAKRLREQGVRAVPRGPRPSTRANAARLTARELEVAALVVDGLSNREVASRLVVSSKTVDHHVSAVLAKLGAASRREVGVAAARLGVTLPTFET